MKKAMLMLADGFEEIEAITAVDLLRRAGIDCQLISVTGQTELVGARGVLLKADSLFSLAEVLEADAIILPGGMQGAKTLQKHLGLSEALLTFSNENKIIAAICAAPMILGSLGLLKGKNAVIYPGMENELLGAHTSLDAVVRDGNIITSRAVGTAIPFALAVIKALVGSKITEEVQAAIVFSEL